MVARAWQAYYWLLSVLPVLILANTEILDSCVAWLETSPLVPNLGCEEGTPCGGLHAASFAVSLITWFARELRFDGPRHDNLLKIAQEVLMLSTMTVLLRPVAATIHHTCSHQPDKDPGKYTFVLQVLVAWSGFTFFEAYNSFVRSFAPAAPPTRRTGLDYQLWRRWHEMYLLPVSATWGFYKYHNAIELPLDTNMQTYFVLYPTFEQVPRLLASLVGTALMIAGLYWSACAVIWSNDRHIWETLQWPKNTPVAIAVAVYLHHEFCRLLGLISRC
ncbi:hypothetical protein K402DRAFT_388547 [Aulographum hederae CBS 113979]|uniref:Uncharacterized protein n=1 Tax=Aulographum hederae CBS 113979 TaxID=1176131 RepID=A0A6G1HFX2_9PEZI|nr:hypothetical protein K402DRAFT_388547 [Aulographum hederae CBS 113979]